MTIPSNYSEVSPQQTSKAKRGISILTILRFVLVIIAVIAAVAIITAVAAISRLARCVGIRVIAFYLGCLLSLGGIARVAFL